jgi:MFS family permease
MHQVPIPKDDDHTGVPVPIEAPTDPSEIAPITAGEVAVATTTPAVTDGKSRFRVGTLVYTTGGLVVLFFWLLFGDFAISLRDRSVGPLMQLMLKGFQASNVMMAVLLLMIPTSITLILTPVVSYKSDRLRSRWGRRIPFLIIPTPIAAFAMIGMAFCPQIAGAFESATNGAISHKAALLITFGVFWTAFEIAAVTAGAVFNGLINDVVPRPVLGRFFGMFRAISLIDGMIFNFLLLDHAESHFTLMCTWIAVVYGFGFTLMCLMVKEGEYPPDVADANDHRAGGFMAAVKVYMRDCFSNPHYLWIFAAFTLTALAANPINAWSIVYAKDLHMNVGRWDAGGVGFGDWKLGYGGVIALTYVFSLVLAYPIGSLVDRFHPLRVATVAMSLYAIACFIGFATIRNTESFGWALLAHGVLSGCYFTSSAALAQVLLPRARFTQFASAGTVVTQLVTLVYTPTLGYVLDLTNSNYRLTFLLSGLFAAASLVLLIKVYRTFMAMGGPKGYVAPLN